MGSKYFLLTFFLFFVFFVHAQKTTKTLKKKDNVTYQLDSSFIAQTGKSAVEIFVDQFADSLNRMPITKVFPIFLEDSEFDYDHPGLSPSHNPNPSRYMIISKVNDCRSLRMILDSKNEKYRLRPRKNNRIEVEYTEFSIYELVERRYKEMGCPLMY